MKRVLIVEDDEWQTELLERYLAHEYQLDTAPNGLVAIDKIDAFRPDLIVLDMLLPAANGVVLLHELQSYPDLATVPVIVCTNGDMSGINLKSYGVQAVLEKGELSAESFRSVVSQCISRSEATNNG